MIASVRVLSVYAQTMARPWPRLLPTFKAWLLSTHWFFFIFLMPNKFQLYGMFQSDNLEKFDRESILS